MKKTTRFILLFANGVCYYSMVLAAYLHFYYYNLMQDVFQLTNSQIGVYGGICGGIAIVAYIVSGILSDKYNPKTLLIITYISQMVILGCYMTLPSYHVLLFLQVLATISCIGLYWSAMSKYVRSLGRPEEEARLFGLHFGFVGLGGSVLTLINAWVISSLNNNASALRFVFFVGIVVLGITTIIDIFLYKPEPQDLSEENRFRLSDILYLLKRVDFWLICLMFMGMYHLAGAITYLSPMLYASYGVPLAVVSILGSFRTYFARAICSPIGGLCIEKIGSSVQFVVYMAIAGLICGLGVLLIPRSSSFIIPIILIFAVLVIANNLNDPAWFTPVSEIGIPKRMLGTGVGFYSAIGFSSDCYLYLLGGHL
ncbi:MAG: nitrate/nitrite transporter, partial [Clostridia bacterium]